jgi:hypothetical protein
VYTYVKGDIFMDLRSSQTDEIDNPPILYRRGVIIVRDPARAALPLTPEARQWMPTILLSGLAAVAGSVLGWLLH